MQKFYDNYCKKRENEDDLYFFDGFQGEIELKRCNIELQKESELLLVRYANPKSSFDRLRFENFKFDEETQTDETFSFDSALSELEENSERFTPDFNQNKEVYFLPTNLEKIVKDIILNNRRNKIPEILIPLIPTDIQTKRDLKFTSTPQVIITPDRIGSFATSFFKLEEASDVCEVKEQMDFIKHNINESFIDGINDYFIGDINQGFGMMERDFEKKYETPSTLHYNFVLRNNNENSMIDLLKLLSEKFKQFPFE